MSVLNRWQDRNPLARRVRRHGALTTLFRAVADDASLALPQGLLMGIAPTLTPPADNHAAQSAMVPELGSANPPLPEDAPFAQPAATMPATADFATMPISQSIQRTPASPSLLPRAVTSPVPQVATPQASAPFPTIAAAMAPARPVAQTIATVTPSVQRMTSGLLSLTEAAGLDQPLPQPMASTPAVVGETSQPQRQASVALQQAIAVSSPALPRASAAMPTAVSPDPEHMGAFSPTPPVQATVQRVVVPGGQRQAAAGASLETAATESTTATLQTTAIGAPSALQRAPTVQTTAPVASPITPPPPRPPAVPPTTGGMDDRTWSRLQAIYRKHQARNAADAGVADQDPTLQRQSASAPSPAMPHEQAHLSQEPEPLVYAPVAPLAADGWSAAPDGATASAAPGGSVIDLTTVPALTDLPVEAQFAPTVRQALSESVQRRVLAEQSPPVQLPPAPVISAQRTTPVVEQGTPQAGLIASTAPSSSAAFAGARDVQMATDARTGDMADSESALPPLSAQTAWAVQRLAHAPLHQGVRTQEAGSQEIMRAVDALAPSVAELKQKASEDQAMRRRLATIQPDQPTESRIDVVLPRRPRPQPRPPAATGMDINAAPSVQRQPVQAGTPTPATPVAQVSQAIETEIGPLPVELWHVIGAPLSMPTPTVASTAESPTEASSQSQSAPAFAPATLAESSASQPAAHLHEAAQPRVMAAAENASAIQRSTLEAPVMASQPVLLQRALTNTEFVSDDVDDDESGEDAVPENATAATASFEAALQAAGIVVQQTALAAVSMAAPTKPVATTTAQRRKRTPAKADVPVQRQVDDETATATEASTPPSSNTATAAPPTPAKAEIDTDELARQVYSQIKRKLAVERERLR